MEIYKFSVAYLQPGQWRMSEIDYTTEPVLPMIRFACYETSPLPSNIFNTLAQ